MHDLALYLSNPIVLVGLCAIAGGGILVFVAWAFTGEYEKGGYESVHKRPSTPTPWDREPDSGEFSTVAARPDTKVPARHRLDTVREETTNLSAYADLSHASARSRVVMIGPEGIIDDEAASRTHRTGETGRVRRAPAEGHVEEEGGADRERGQLPREAVEDGEEGGAHEEGPARPVAAERFFRNTVTGEIIFVDAYGRKVDFDA